MPAHALPPGPRLPGPAQAVLWGLRYPEFTRACHARFGPTLTVRPGTMPRAVLTADRDAIRRLFTGEPLRKRNSADVDEAIRRLQRQAGSLRAVVMVATSKAAARFVERARDAGLNLLFANISPGANELAEELAQLGARYADGVVMTQVVPLPTSRASAILKYQETLKKHAGGEKPDFVSLEAYVSARVLIEGLQRTGRALTLDRLIETLEAMQGIDLGIGAPISFGPSEHQGSHKVWGTVIDARGAFRALDLE